MDKSLAELEDKHEGHRTEDFLKKFWISLVLAVPIFFYSEMAMELLGIRGPLFPGWEFVMLALGSVVFFYCGWVFLEGARREFHVSRPGMMTLISIAVSAAYLYSFFSVLAGTGHDLLFELASLIAIMLLGHYIEMRAIVGAQGALKELARLLPDTAEVVRGGGSTKVALSELRAGDMVLVRPGGKVPADGVIVEGSSDLNESIITGESKPIAKKQGDEVIAGSINGDGSLTIQITKIGQNTFLAGVMRLVAEAQASKSRLQILSDKAAFYLTMVALFSGALTLLAWIAARGDIVFAIERMVAVLVIACPHALGLAVPLVAAISTSMAAQNGLLIKRRLSLEAARSVSVILFDKTGTLTEGAFSVLSASDEALALAAAVEMHSEHPIAQAIVREARRRDLPIGQVRDFKRLPGVGAEAQVDNTQIFVGHTGGDDIVVQRDGVNVGEIKLADAVRSEAKEAINTLKSLGLKIAMITGDSETVARDVARELGIDEYFARVRPEEKVEKVRLLQANGECVAMVGDGVNDAPALAQADLGIAIGAGTNVAIESAGIILVRSDPRDIAKIVGLSRLTYRKMMQNLFWASGYNVIAIPLAAGVLASYGVILQPALAAILMSGSTVIVAVNAMLLRRKRF